MTIGLSQIMLMGYSAFGDSSAAPQNMFMPNEDYVARSRSIIIIQWMRSFKNYYSVNEIILEIFINVA